jgi:hypothetical protein
MKTVNARIREKRNLVAKLLAGDEPTVDLNSRFPTVELARAYSWYNINYTIEEGREWLSSYLKSKEYSQDFIDNLMSTQIPMVYCSIARLLSRDISLPEKTMFNFKKFLEQQLPKQVEIKTKRVTYIKAPTADSKIETIMSNIEEATDQFITTGSYDYSLYNDIKNQDIKSPSVKEIYNRLMPRIQQVLELADNPKSDIAEYYIKYTREQKKIILQFHRMLETDCKKALQATKVVRQNKKKRPVSSEKLLKNFKFKKEDVSLKILSIEPSKILTSTMLVVYNTKYKRMTVFVAKEGEKLSVKGTSIQNYDETKTESKRVKKPEEATTQILSGTNNSILKTFAKFKSKPQTITNRINEDTLLLRVS